LHDIQNDITKLIHCVFYEYIRSQIIEAELRGIKPKEIKYAVKIRYLYFISTTD